MWIVVRSSPGETAEDSTFYGPFPTKKEADSHAEGLTRELESLQISHGLGFYNRYLSRFLMTPQK